MPLTTAVRRAVPPRAGKVIPMPLILAIGAVYFLSMLAVFIRTRVDPGTQMVAWPIGVIVLAAAGLVLVIHWRDRSPSYFEVGVLYAGIVALYGAYPPLIAALNRFQFPATTDGRFSSAQPSAAEMASITWWYAIYLVAFCAAYLLVRPRHSTRREPVHPPGRALIIAAVLLLLVSKLFFLVLAMFYNLRAGSYSEQYILVRSLPLVLRQLANVFEGMSVSLQIIILAALFCYYHRTKWIIVIFVAALGGFVVMARGGRTELFVVVLAALQLRDQLVRRIPAKVIAIVAVAGFALYMMMGILRQDDRQFRMLHVEEITAGYTDFEGIFANAYDLKYILNISGAFRGQPALLFADIAAVIPQQFLPFAKTSASYWYVTTYYPISFAEGGGMAFGVVSEAIVGYGWVEMLLRGTFVGVLLALLHRRFVNGSVGVMFLALYVWMTVSSYQMCRNTTLSIISMSLYRFVPAVVATLLLAAAFRRGRSRLFAFR